MLKLTVKRWMFQRACAVVLAVIGASKLNCVPPVASVYQPAKSWPSLVGFGGWVAVVFQ
jgi:hypothetical protein